MQSHLSEAPLVGCEVNAAIKVSPNKVLAIVCVGIILANLDLFIVNVGLPNIAHDFKDSNLDDLSWVLNGYAIAYASLLVFFGRLAERYKRNSSFLLGVATFTAASAACAAANNVESLVLFRIVQAAGAALMTPASLGLLLASFPAEQRGGAVRTWTAVGGFAAALGPLVGGLLVTFSWRWIFLVNVPIGLVALWIGWRKLPAIAGHPVARPNLGAAVLVTAGVALLSFAIVKVNQWGWASKGIWITAAVAAVCITLFVAQCLRSSNPFIDPKLFRVRQFTGVALATALFSAAFGAMLLSIVLWDQQMWGWPAFTIGLSIAPGPLLVPTTSLLFSKKLIARFGAPAVINAGVMSFALGLAWWALALGAQPSFPLVCAGMLFTGVGVGLALPTLMGVGMGSLPPSSFATGSGVINMIRQAGMAIGVALLVAIIGSNGSFAQRHHAFQIGWWTMVVLLLLSIVPTWTLIRASRKTPTQADTRAPVPALSALDSSKELARQAAG
jgi:EmrB/QacA subfamily drug resistance transporter